MLLSNTPYETSRNSDIGPRLNLHKYRTCVTEMGVNAKCQAYNL